MHWMLLYHFTREVGLAIALALLVACNGECHLQFRFVPTMITCVFLIFWSSWLESFSTLRSNLGDIIGGQGTLMNWCLILQARNTTHESILYNHRYRPFCHFHGVRGPSEPLFCSGLSVFP